METTSYGNEWVENYLDALVRGGGERGSRMPQDIVIHSARPQSPDARAPASAQLSYGLSTEYSKKPQAKDKDKVEKVDADRLVFAKYYVQQLLQLDEDALHNAWVKVSQENQYRRCCRRGRHRWWCRSGGVGWRSRFACRSLARRPWSFGTAAPARLRLCAHATCASILGRCERAGRRTHSPHACIGGWNSPPPPPHTQPPP